MPTRFLLSGLLATALCASPLPADAQATDLPTARPMVANSAVTSEGFEDLSYGKTFFLEVPMVDAPPLMNPEEGGGIGSNITAESIINNVRYAGAHPDIQHVVFMMRTGGGKVFHAEAMKDIIEEYHRTTEFHIIIDDAISAGTWTVFSCDTIFMIDGGTVGGAVMYITFPDGSVQESPEIPAVAARMSKLAERNGHPGVLAPAMMHLPAELHYWEEDGEVVLSGSAPSSRSSVQNHRMIDSENDVLTLTSQDAFMIGLAERIEEFDASLVGGHIGLDNWTRANRFGQVTHEIGDLYNGTRPLQDQFERRKSLLPYVRNTRENRENPQRAPLLEQHQIFEKLIEAYSKINEALNNLPSVHPERHIYLTGEGERTILADPEQWQADVDASKAYCRDLTSGMRDLRTAFRMMEEDDDNLNGIQDAINLIIGRIDGIAQQGNAAYWIEHADDIID
ncbi:hypothetical protein OT109_05220 [Phycisphaeraceae bacterium D3-23]